MVTAAPVGYKPAMLMRLMFKIAAFNLVLLAAVVVAVELLWGSWLARDPLDRFTLPRDITITVRAEGLYPGAGTFTLARDHWGMRRSAGDSTTVTPAAVTIITLGGAATAQGWLPEDLTWQAEMARALAADGRPVVVANAGIDGLGSVGHRRALSDWLPNVPGLKPRFVIVLAGADDLAEDPAAQPLRPRTLPEMSGLLRLLAGRPAALAPKPASPEFRADSPDGYMERLAEMGDLIHAWGAVPIFVTQAVGEVPPEQRRRLARIDAATLSVCRERGLLCLDLAHELVLEPADFADPVRLAPEGAAKVGRWLAGKLAGLV